MSVPAPGCRRLALAPDVSALVTLGDDGLTLHELPDRPAWSVPFPPGETERLLWSPEGEWLFTLSAGRLSAWDPACGEPRRLPGHIGADDVSALDISPDGRLLAIGTGAGRLLVLDLRTGEATSLPGGPDRVSALAWRPGTRDLCVARPGVLQFWSWAGRVMLTYRSTPDAIRHLAWVPDGGLIATAGTSGISTYSPQGVAQPARLPGTAAEAVAFSRDGGRLLLALADGDVLLTDRSLGDGERHRADAAAGALQVGRTGLVAVRTDARTVSLWSLPDTLPSAAGALSSAVRRWAVRQGTTLGRAPAVVTELGAPAARPTVTREPGRLLRWWPDGRTVCRDSGERTLVRHALPSGPPLWETPLPGPPHDVAVAPGGRWAAAVAGEHDGPLLVVDGESGRVTATATGAPALAWSAGPAPLLAFPRGPGDPPGEVVVVTQHGVQVRRLAMHDGVCRLAWSPDGRWLAATGRGHVVLWESESWRRSRAPLPSGPAGRLLGDLAWSPDGRWLAAVAAGTGAESWVVVWNTTTWEAEAGLGPTFPPGRAAVLSWSPDSEVIAFPAPDGIGVELWSAHSHRRLRLLAPPHDAPAPIREISWGPLGDLLHAGHGDGVAVRWDLFGDDLPPAGEDIGLPHPRETLVKVASASAAVGGSAPLSVLADLLSLLDGQPPRQERLRPFASHPRLADLRGLRWPQAARAGLAVLLAADLPADPRYAAPAGTRHEQLTAALTTVLTGPSRPVVAPEAPYGLEGALAGVDDRLLGLLAMLGPETVAEDPALPARLRHQRDLLPELPAARRRLLDLRVTLSQDGWARGRGSGHSHAGLSRHGQANALLPTQLALPPAVLSARHTRDELLYRTKLGNLPPRRRSMVFLLDDTPAAHGQVGVTLRLCAHILAAVLVGRGLSCALVTIGDPPRVLRLGHPADLVGLWTLTSAAEPDLPSALRQAGSVSLGLTDPVSGPPRVAVLTHPYLDLSGQPSCFSELYAVRVRYPLDRSREPAPGPRTFFLDSAPGPEELGRVLGLLLGDAPDG